MKQNVQQAVRQQLTELALSKIEEKVFGFCQECLKEIPFSQEVNSKGLCDKCFTIVYVNM